MRRTFSVSGLCLTIIILFIPWTTLYGHESCTSVYGEVLKDIVNYSNENPSLIARGRFSENIDDRLIINCSVLHDISNEKNDYTWNIGLYGSNEPFNFCAGNYSLGFGSGFIMGKKKFISSDPFTKSLTVSIDNAISPSTGSNPAGAFFGAAAKFNYTGDEFSAGAVPFYSSQKRYITEEELSRGYISSSIPTLEERTTSNSKYSESAYITNYGAMLWLTWIDYIVIQCYAFQTAIKDSDGNSLKWSYNADHEDGINRSGSAGVFIEYADEVFSFFVEPAVSVSQYDMQVKGFGMLWGCGVKNRKAMLTVRGKNCDPEFHADYSSGDRYPQDVFEIKGRITPHKKIEIGGTVYSEKNLNPSYNDDEADGTSREEGFTVMKPFKWMDLNLGAARTRDYSDNLESEKLKFSSSAIFTLPWNLFFRVKSDAQREGHSRAYVSACEMKYLLLENFTISAGYTDIRVKGSTGIYAAIIPAPEAELSTSLYREQANGMALKIRFKKDDLSFHVRGSFVKCAGEKEVTAESSLGFIF